MASVMTVQCDIKSEQQASDNETSVRIDGVLAEGKISLAQGAGMDTASLSVIKPSDPRLGTLTSQIMQFLVR